LVVYPDARVEPTATGLLLKPSKAHIPKQATSGLLTAPPESPPPPAVLQQVVSPLKATADLPASMVTPKPPAIRLATATYEKAKSVAPGWDVYVLENEWREWIADKELPTNPDAAFIGFCKQRYKNNGRK
jgi:hypothetical protein